MNNKITWGEILHYETLIEPKELSHTLVLHLGSLDPIS